MSKYGTDKPDLSIKGLDIIQEEDLYVIKADI